MSGPVDVRILRLHPWCDELQLLVIRGELSGGVSDLFGELRMQNVTVARLPRDHTEETECSASDDNGLEREAALRQKNVEPCESLLRSWYHYN